LNRNADSLLYHFWGTGTSGAVVWVDGWLFNLLLFFVFAFVLFSTGTVFSTSVAALGSVVPYFCSSVNPMDENVKSINPAAKNVNNLFMLFLPSFSIFIMIPLPPLCQQFSYYPPLPLKEWDDGEQSSPRKSFLSPLGGLV